jgi:hypothetical protein
MQRVPAGTRDAGNLIEVGAEWQRIRLAGGVFERDLSGVQTVWARPVSANKTVL